ncbi:MAG: DNA-binding protein [Erythrobacter sp.]|nr:MAG: DNA-binding protein [Erythrobacter sp.]
MPSVAPSEQRSDQKRQFAIEPITMRVPEACRYLGIGRSTLYVLIGEGEIEFIKLRSSTLVLTASLRSLIERKRERGSGQQKAPGA